MVLEFLRTILSLPHVHSNEEDVSILFLHLTFYAEQAQFPNENAYHHLHFPLSFPSSFRDLS